MISSWDEFHPGEGWGGGEGGKISRVNTLLERRFSNHYFNIYQKLNVTTEDFEDTAMTYFCLNIINCRNFKENSIKEEDQKKITHFYYYPSLVGWVKN